LNVSIASIKVHVEIDTDFDYFVIFNSILYSNCHTNSILRDI